MPAEQPNQPRRLGERVRRACELRHLSARSTEAYLHWIRRYWQFCERLDPAAFGAEQVMAFLTHLAVHGRVAASTQNQALAAMLFLYRHVLEQDLP